MRPQLQERDDAFVAIERHDEGYGWCRVCRGGEVKVIFASDFPCTVGDVNFKGLDLQSFCGDIWRSEGCEGGAGA
jgi:hypothetical protein